MRRLPPTNEAVRLMASGACIALLAGACSKAPVAADPGAIAATASVAAPAAAAVAPAPAASPERRLRGNAIVGKDGYGVVPCGASEQVVFGVAPDGAAAPILEKFLQGGAHEFFLDGWVVDGADGGRPQLTRIERVGSEGLDCKEALDKVVFAARGTEPFWAITDGEGGLKLERPGQQPLLATASWRDEHGVQIAESREVRLEVRLEPGLCSDGMSDTLYGWKATATFDGKENTGCGYAGLAPAH